MDQKPVALWAVPRSISTAFERIFVERSDFEVFHEPFSASYYYSEDRLSDRYADVPPDPEYNYDRVVEEIFEPEEKRVFLKDMPHHLGGLLGPEFASRFVNTFIIRDPKYVLLSLYKMWPDFTPEEAGYEQMYELFRYAKRNGQQTVVVDAMNFSENPGGVLATYCERLGIPFDEDSLSWKKRDVRRWGIWDGWHDTAEQSTGIEPATRKDPNLPRKLMGVYEQCLPSYYELAAHVIPAKNSKATR